MDLVKKTSARNLLSTMETWREDRLHKLTSTKAQTQHLNREEKRNQHTEGDKERQEQHAHTLH